MRNRLRTVVRGVLLAAGILAGVALCHAWFMQERAALSCTALLRTPSQHNGYFQIDVLAQHPSEPYFDSSVRVFYTAAELPPDRIELAREAVGLYARSISQSDLAPFSDGKITKELKFSLPTAKVTQRRFPLDSPAFNLVFDFEPARQPTFVVVRNATQDFIPICDTLRANWEAPNRLLLSIEFRRNPVVQTVVVMIGIAAMGFALLLSQVRDQEALAVTTGSFFFSLWSLRGIVAPPTVEYPTFLDMWLMLISLVVFFVVAWRLTAGPERRELSD